MDSKVNNARLLGQNLELWLYLRDTYLIAPPGILVISQNSQNVEMRINFLPWAFQFSDVEKQNVEQVDTTTVLHYLSSLVLSSYYLY